jgi:predicted acyltransferase
MPATDEDLRTVGEQLILAAAERGAVFCGFLFRVNPPMMFSLSNTSESGAELAALYRRFADMIEKKSAAGDVMHIRVQKPS